MTVIVNRVCKTLLFSESSSSQKATKGIAPVRDSADSVYFAPVRSLETNSMLQLLCGLLRPTELESVFPFLSSTAHSLITHSSFSTKHASRLWSPFHAKTKRICNWNVYFTCIVYWFDPIIRSDYWNLSRWHQVDDERPWALFLFSITSRVSVRIEPNGLCQRQASYTTTSVVVAKMQRASAAGPNDRMH